MTDHDLCARRLDGRPIDILALGGAIYVLEYSRPLDHKGEVPMLPGRLLELKPN